MGIYLSCNIPRYKEAQDNNPASPRAGCGSCAGMGKDRGPDYSSAFSFQLCFPCRRFLWEFSVPVLFAGGTSRCAGGDARVFVSERGGGLAGANGILGAAPRAG